ncbi:hypothetical protein LTR10_014798 [Elasticomyces elasticus]|uniref:FAD-binding domain-containing protein n=1 Tax=Exophiala sideris TaxID=1016849 RepID=A0ABR0JGV1_9EURO|nr:hypothetical protein LTR10_014798 [Elasticomyces elasticus]KAK5025641.1 hypothetical protein LTS07_007845 [Exophiala sideris]KAK5033149.1 hypothetical protein LTR13_007114 [Exophiala sideris]KAK5063634.1 hypothetical protein LTR69_004340 [Exophiala sideris]KAK5180532.1 hypothetical protein LTR44_006846 [Eurotiomycetes sp. CCFEE 6388]
MVDVSKKLDIIVVGGSLAGLMTSIPLKRLGHRVTIFERSPTPLLHDQGAGVVAGGETQAFFHKHDLSRRPMAVTSQTRFYLDHAGKVIDREDHQQRMTSWDLLYYLGRANFDSVESEYVNNVPKQDGQASYEYGRSVTGVRDAGDRVEVTYEMIREGEGKQTSTATADLLIAADGPSSHTRNMLLGEKAAERKYAGYVAFRGTVPEAEVSNAAAAVFVERFTFFHADGTQILSYTIPGKAGSLDKGKRLVNWVWYWNVDESSEEYKELFTDTEGGQHRFTLPTGGKMQPQVWDRQKARGDEGLPPQFAEIVNKTKSPFVQAITDVQPPEKGTKVGRLLNGKALLVGDALAGFRPHTAASTSQAAYHALMLEKVFKEEIDWEEYEKHVLEFAWGWQRRGVNLGNRSQFGHHPLAD